MIEMHLVFSLDVVGIQIVSQESVNYHCFLNSLPNVLNSDGVEFLIAYAVILRAFLILVFVLRYPILLEDFCNSTLFKKWTHFLLRI